MANSAAYDPFLTPSLAPLSPATSSVGRGCPYCHGAGHIVSGDGWNEPVRDEYCDCPAGVALEQSEADAEWAWLARMEEAE